jgi:hypothetical protein
MKVHPEIFMKIKERRKMSGARRKDQRQKESEVCDGREAVRLFITTPRRLCAAPSLSKDGSFSLLIMPGEATMFMKKQPLR